MCRHQHMLQVKVIGWTRESLTRCRSVPLVFLEACNAARARLQLARKSPERDDSLLFLDCSDMEHRHCLTATKKGPFVEFNCDMFLYSDLCIRTFYGHGILLTVLYRLFCTSGNCNTIFIQPASFLW